MLHFCIFSSPAVHWLKTAFILKCTSWTSIFPIFSTKWHGYTVNYLNIASQNITETLIDMPDVILSCCFFFLEFCIYRPLWQPDLCAVPSPAVCHHGDSGADPTYSVRVCVRRTVSAQLGAAAAAVRHQEEKKDGGDIQAQRRGDETDESRGIWKAWPASTVAQRRAPHIMNVWEQLHTLSIRVSAPAVIRHTKHCLCRTFSLMLADQTGNSVSCFTAWREEIHVMSFCRLP